MREQDIIHGSESNFGDETSHTVQLSPGKLQQELKKMGNESRSILEQKQQEI